MAALSMTPEPYTPAYREDLLLWCAGLAVTLLAAMIWWPAAHFAGQAIPVGHDSYYHAVRVLDAVSRDSVVVFAFDPMMHAPEGNWVNWPWGYDGLLSLITLLLHGLVGVDIHTAMILSPLFWVPVNLTLVMLLSRQLQLGTAGRIALVLAWSLHPLVQAVHGVGMLDHHQTEMAMFLASCCAWLGWLKRPGRVAPALLAGFVPAIAPALHTSLFLCQPGIALAAFFLWTGGMLPPLRDCRWMLLGAAVGSALALMPAPLVDSHVFAYHTLSWFHPAVAILTALGVCTLSVLQGHPRAVFLLGLGLAATTAIALPFVWEAAGYIFGTESNVSEMPESRSYVLGWIGGDTSFLDLMKWYGPWAILLPLSVVGSLAVGLRSRDTALRVLCGFALFGLFLLCGQFRFHPFGLVFLLLLPLLAYDRLMPRYAPRLAPLAPLLSLLFVLPGLPRLLHTPDTAMNSDYDLLVPLYQKVAQRCALQPGTILANQNDGHYLRYFSACAVVANNFLVDSRSRQKASQWREMMRDAADGQTLPEWLDYLFVRVSAADLGNLEGAPAGPARLELLSEEFVSEYLEPAWQSPVRITVKGKSVPLARLYVVAHPEAP